jgi:Deoxyinosine 3''endonuclease (endonuclease V)
VLFYAKFPEFDVIEIKKIEGKAKFPYIPGFLAFREGENIVKVIEKIEKEVDCFILMDMELHILKNSDLLHI